MSNRHEVTTRPENRFEYREGRGEGCEGCNSRYTRESYHPGVYRCPKCEAYYASFDALTHSYATMLEEWRKRMGLSREAALRNRLRSPLNCNDELSQRHQPRAV